MRHASSFKKQEQREGLTFDCAVFLNNKGFNRRKMRRAWRRAALQNLAAHGPFFVLWEMLIPVLRDKEAARKMKDLIKSVGPSAALSGMDQALSMNENEKREIFFQDACNAFESFCGPHDRQRITAWEERILRAKDVFGAGRTVLWIQKISLLSPDKSALKHTTRRIGYAMALVAMREAIRKRTPSDFVSARDSFDSFHLFNKKSHEDLRAIAHSVHEAFGKEQASFINDLADRWEVEEKSGKDRKTNPARIAEGENGPQNPSFGRGGLRRIHLQRIATGHKPS